MWLKVLLSDIAHTPFVAPPAFPQRFIKQGWSSGGPKASAGRLGMIENIDANFGRMMKQLGEWGLLENTLIIFMTDNGSVASSVYNAGMKGGKTSVNEGGSRVPFFIRWPGKIEVGRDIDVLARHFDLLPTFAELAGADVSKLSLDGKSLIPLLENPNALWDKRTFFYHRGRWGNPASKHEKHHSFVSTQ